MVCGRVVVDAIAANCTRETRKLWCSEPSFPLPDKYASVDAIVQCLTMELKWVGMWERGQPS